MHQLECSAISLNSPSTRKRLYSLPLSSFTDDNTKRKRCNTVEGILSIVINIEPDIVAKSTEKMVEIPFTQEENEEEIALCSFDAKKPERKSKVFKPSPLSQVVHCQSFEQSSSTVYPTANQEIVNAPEIDFRRLADISRRKLFIYRQNSLRYTLLIRRAMAFIRSSRFGFDPIIRPIFRPQNMTYRQIITIEKPGKKEKDYLKKSNAKIPIVYHENLNQRIALKNFSEKLSCVEKENVQSELKLIEVEDSVIVPKQPVDVNLLELLKAPLVNAKPDTVISLYPSRLHASDISCQKEKLTDRIISFVSCRTDLEELGMILNDKSSDFFRFWKLLENENVPSFPEKTDEDCLIFIE